nr:cytochrome c oxidase subunit II [Burkholderia gladioli]
MRARLAAMAVAVPAQDALQPAGPQAQRIADLWYLTVVVCGVVLAAVLAALLIALVRRAPRGDDPGAPAPKQAGRAVAGATVLSAVVLLGLILADVMTDRALSRLPAPDALHVEIVGRQWWWDVRYASPGGATVATPNELHVPVGQPVVVSLKAGDVIHTFWVPNLHGKKDMIPGSDAAIVFRADRAGIYRGQCAEFCGLEHALMAFVVVAEPRAAFERWLAQQQRPSAVPRAETAREGERIFLSANCVTCHTVRGTSAAGTLGPDLTHLMSRGQLAAGTVPNDHQHLRLWIERPGQLKPGTTMPASTLSPADLDTLAAWLETLR